MDDTLAVRRSFYLSVASLITLLVAILVAGAGAKQELFETVRAAGKYAEALVGAGARLRWVLFVDSIFLILYLGAIGFALLGFARRNLPAAWLAGVALVALVVLDVWENQTMVQSLDLLDAQAPLSMSRVIHQVNVSSFKWFAATLTLFSTSFVLPDERPLERSLVWGSRLGMLVAVPLFVFAPANLGELGGWFIYATMLAGFFLLALVTRGRMGGAPGEA